MLDRIDYAAHGKIKFNTDFALFRDGPGDFPVTSSTWGNFSARPGICTCSRPPARTPPRARFSTIPRIQPADSPARELPKGAGFAGFRFQESRTGDQQKLDWHANDWVAFLGASYFRAIGELEQYGLSARGIAIDVSAPAAPKNFRISRASTSSPRPTARPIFTVYAALEGPSVTGAYKFVMQRDKAVNMDIEARLFLRHDVGQLGIAPMTSMYWFSETNKPGHRLAAGGPRFGRPGMWTGAGEYIWRPLNDTPTPRLPRSADKRHRGFGLFQRDRISTTISTACTTNGARACWVEPWRIGEKERCNSWSCPG